jgi:hypothetical protein
MSTGVFLQLGLFLVSDVRIIEYSVNNRATKDNPNLRGLESRIEIEAIYRATNLNELSSFQSYMTEYSLRFAEVQRKKDIVSTKSLSLYVIMDPNKAINAAPNHVIVDTTSNIYTGSQSIQNGPFVKSTVTQIAGTSTLLLRMVIEWTADSLFSTSNILSFYTRATFSIDETGSTTIRRTGMLETSRWFKDAHVSKPGTPPGFPYNPEDRSGSRNDVPRPNPNPLAPVTQGDSWRNDVVLDQITDPIAGDMVTHADFLRNFVAGNLYPGFRRIAQEYAVDESGYRLLFDITDRDFHRSLPAPARVGNCHYTFERSIDDKNQALGIKHFIASVKGDRDVTIGSLLTLCIRLSQNRIDYVNDLIIKARITEENMLTENSITFEVAAKATSGQLFTPAATASSSSAGTSTLVNYNHLKNILSSIPIPNSVPGAPQTFQFVPAEMPSSYGVSSIIRVVTSPYAPVEGPTNPAKTDASTLQPKERIPGATYIFTNAVFDQFIDAETAPETDERFRYREWRSVNPNVPTGPNKGDAAAGSAKKRETGQNGSTASTNTPPNDIDSAYASNGYTTNRIETGIIEVPAVSFEGKTKVFQVGMPRVTREDVVEASAKNRAPKRRFNDAAPNSVARGFDINVSSGSPDLNGNRLLSAVMTRQSVIVPPPDLPTEGVGPSESDPSWEVVDRNFEGETVRIVQYNPKKVPLPPSETQGNTDPRTQPDYTKGLSSEGYLA